MKVLRKVLLILPLLALGLTLLVSFLALVFGFGKVITFRMIDDDYNYVLVNTSAYSFKVFSADSSASASLDALPFGNFCSIAGFIIVLVCTLLTFLNISDKKARGSTLLVASILSFVATVLLVVRPALLVNIRTTDFGDVFEGFNWAAFGCASLIFLPCLILFILNKTLFKKVLNQQPAEQPLEEAPVEEEPVEEAPAEEPAE